MQKVIFCILVVSIWFLPVTTFAQTPGPVYIVQPGDSLYVIAQRFGITVDAIASANGITDTSLIAPGLELVIPGYEGVAGVLSFHELKFGETIPSLSVKLGIPLEDLIKLNRVLREERLYLGQAMIITMPSEEDRSATYKLLLTEEGESKLAFAARNGINPWSIDHLDRRLDRAWILGNERLLVSGQDPLLHSLPFPLLDVEVEPDRVMQGQTLEITIMYQGSLPLIGSLGDGQLHFYSLSEDQMICLQGIYALTEPGLYDLEIGIWDAQMEKTRFSYRQPIRIVDGEYYYDPVLYVPEETVNSETIELEDALVESVIHQTTEERYWDGIFQFPSSYTESFPSYFGSRRNYNNQGYHWYHTGLDLYGGVGTPIFAPARGKVVYTGFLDVRGNATYIDHGWGVFSGYLHQSAMEVSVGDWVEPGQQIGLVGSTGRVTGPHLHWEIWVGGVPVDPLEWTSEEFP